MLDFWPPNMQLAMQNKEISCGTIAAACDRSLLCIMHVNNLEANNLFSLPNYAWMERNARFKIRKSDVVSSRNPML
jgi:hypothetical protein